MLTQRKGKGIWQNLYEFPLIETSEDTDASSVANVIHPDNAILKEALEAPVLYNEEPVVHKLSHQHLYTRFWIVTTGNLNGLGVPFSRIDEYAVPVLISNFISEFSGFKE